MAQSPTTVTVLSEDDFGLDCVVVCFVEVEGDDEDDVELCCWVVVPDELEDCVLVLVPALVLDDDEAEDDAFLVFVRASAGTATWPGARMSAFALLAAPAGAGREAGLSLELELPPPLRIAPTPKPTASATAAATPIIQPRGRVATGALACMASR